VLAGDVEVLRALIRRRDGGTPRGGRWDDGHRIAAVVGGGGMRGAYTGGMAHALHDAGLEPFFDVVYGSSAGAYVGAALVLGDGCGAGRIFHEDMACRAFADPRRLGTRRPVVSLDHLIDEIMVSAKPMPWERLHDATVSLRVIATAVDDLTPHVLEPRTVAEWRAALRATATIPYLAGPAVELHGRRWIDGSVSEPLPVPGMGEPDLILAPTAHDAHQDHRTLAKLVPTVFRDHLTLGYEILKWESDLAQPTVFLPLAEPVMREKVAKLHEHYGSQRDRTWFDAETFSGLARVRGVQCHARYAEAFHAAKMVLGVAPLPGLDPTD